MSRHLSRRQFLAASAAAAAVAQAGPLAPRLLARGARAGAAAPDEGSPALVCIYLRGGADPLHMFIPWEDDDYLAVRPTLKMGEEEGVVPLDDTFAMHPALAPLKPAWDAGQLAPVINAGSPHRTRSHFDAQDWMEYAAPGNRGVRDGWLNRYLELSATEDASEFRAVGMQELLPRSLRGRYPVLAVPTRMSRRSSEETLDRFEDFYGDGSDVMEGGEAMRGRREDDGTGVVESGRVTIETLRRFQEIVGEAEKERSRRGGRGGRGGARGDGNGDLTVVEDGVEYPDSRFGRRLRQIGLVLKADAGLEVAGIDYGGWDDHTRQGGVEGRMADRMNDLAQALAAFRQDLGPRMDKTTVMVMTEFGRTVHENGNNGTDHGHGGAMIVMGGGVEGGQVHGDWDGLAKSSLYQGRDLPVRTDFRDVMAASLQHTFDFELPDGFFPGYEPEDLRELY